MKNKFNSLRAAVLGSNDGILSTAGLLMGMVGAVNSTSTVLIAGLISIVAGACSMAEGEYVSVSVESDAEKDLHIKEVVSAWGAAGSSIAFYLIGAILPLLAAILSPSNIRPYVIFVTVALCLTATGFIAAKLANCRSKTKSAVRTLLWGCSAMLITYGIGRLVGLLI